MKEYRMKVKKKLMQTIDNKKNLLILGKKKINEYLTKLVRIFNKKEKYHYYGRDNRDYYGITDIENLFSEIDKKDYYKPILANNYKSILARNYKPILAERSFKVIINIMKAEETERKIYQ